ncbi:SMP-30/gluconolactonase/LRE family protein [Phytoactinopolyspora alkaliphila]|uniref:SMP-30/gluconolactonase/LRE family protein n=1 Tax=Phytoactinopolyspora alkaliphila TaxID=1783498 RepID=A0A6N9YRZ5_9ACTN|nr:SMP-30/gluconolactonase/LRE family protein [Phytoactinopolyspora alkaliphila]NED97811.1 SMP-30/gluconolactonase/LRE family protein [Phytoactinopolyspora alkaliphila]
MNPHTGPHVLMAGLAFGESPRWRDGRLWFADWGTHEIMTVDDDGEGTMVAQVDSFPFSFDWLLDGRMLISSGTDHALLSLESRTSLSVYADLKAISDKAWNEIVVASNGNAYVNSIGFDMDRDEDSDRGLIAVVSPDGQARQVADRLHFPNGMAITADGSTLIVAESYGNKLTAFDIEQNGDLSGQRTWADLGDGSPDGICLDAEGAVWYADVPNRRCVRVEEGGKVLHTIDVDRGCFGCMLGGPDGRTLYLMAAEWPTAMTEGSRTGRVLTAKAPAPHAGRP